MTASDNAPPAPPSAPRVYPLIAPGDEGALQVQMATTTELEALLGMKTSDGASGVLKTALEALGRPGQDKAQFVAAMYAEVEPRDGIEAMLVSQMTLTHIAMTNAAARLAVAGLPSARESNERSMARLSRMYVAQMGALKKYRSKAQQVVRVERVDVHEGGQAIVGDVRHGGTGGT